MSSRTGVREELEAELQRSSKAKTTRWRVGQVIVRAPPVSTVSGERLVPGKTAGIALATQQAADARSAYGPGGVRRLTAFVIVIDVEMRGASVAVWPLPAQRAYSALKVQDGPQIACRQIVSAALPGKATAALAVPRASAFSPVFDGDAASLAVTQGVACQRNSVATYHPSTIAGSTDIAPTSSADPLGHVQSACGRLVQSGITRRRTRCLLGLPIDLGSVPAGSEVALGPCVAHRRRPERRGLDPGFQGIR